MIRPLVGFIRRAIVFLIVFGMIYRNFISIEKHSLEFKDRTALAAKQFSVKHHLLDWAQKNHLQFYQGFLGFWAASALFATFGSSFFGLLTALIYVANYVINSDILQKPPQIHSIQDINRDLLLHVGVVLAMLVASFAPGCCSSKTSAVASGVAAEEALRKNVAHSGGKKKRAA